MRQLILEVRAASAGVVIGTEKRTYTRLLADAEGRTIPEGVRGVLEGVRGRLGHPATAAPEKSDRITFLELSKTLP